MLRREVLFGYIYSRRARDKRQKFDLIGSQCPSRCLKKGGFSFSLVFLLSLCISLLDISNVLDAFEFIYDVFTVLFYLSKFDFARASRSDFRSFQYVMHRARRVCIYACMYSQQKVSRKLKSIETISSSKRGMLTLHPPCACTQRRNRSIPRDCKKQRETNGEYNYCTGNLEF